MDLKEAIREEIRELSDHIRENKDLLIRAYKDRDEVWIKALKEGIDRQTQHLSKLQDKFKVLSKNSRPWFPPLAKRDSDDWMTSFPDAQDAFEDEVDEEVTEFLDREPIGLLPRGNPIVAPRTCECGAKAVGFADPGPWHNDKCPLWEAK